MSYSIWQQLTRRTVYLGRKNRRTDSGFNPKNRRGRDMDLTCVAKLWEHFIVLAKMLGR